MKLKIKYKSWENEITVRVQENGIRLQNRLGGRSKDYKNIKD